MINLNQVPKIILTIVVLMTLVSGGLIAACQPAVGIQAEARTEETCLLPPEEVPAMNLVEASTVPNTAIPPIDTSAPTEIETATFSLG
jgi:hypothetical protein